jgi:hypothetical protein
MATSGRSPPCRQDSSLSSRSTSSVYSSYGSVNEFFRGAAPHPTNFANVEDMLFEVFRCEETDTFDSIAIKQFLKVSGKSSNSSKVQKFKYVLGNV